MKVIIRGILVKKLELETGTSAKGEWSKQQFCIENRDNPQYPTSYAFTSMNDRGNIVNIPIGTILEVTAYIRSMYYEKNGREGWFTNMNVASIQPLNQQQPQQSYQQPLNKSNTIQKVVIPKQYDDDDLNF